MEDKKFKITSQFDSGQITWEVVRVGHATKGDYIFATFYDRGAVQLFTEALESKGFQQLDLE